METDVYIVAHIRGNRRIRAKSPIDAWRNVCPNELDIQIKPLDRLNKKFQVVKTGKRIGHITRVPKGML